MAKNKKYNNRNNNNSRRAAESYRSRTTNAEQQQIKKAKQALGADLATLLVDSLRNGNDPFQGFTGLTAQLKAKQEELDIMAADSLPAAILTDYVSEVLLPNSSGDLISIVANDSNHQPIVDSIYKRLSIPDEKCIYSILKNGIVLAKFKQVVQQSLAGQVAANENLSDQPTDEIVRRALEQTADLDKELENQIAALEEQGYKLTPQKQPKAATQSVAKEATYVREPGTILPNISILPDTYTVFPVLKYERCVAYLEVKNAAEVFSNFDWQEQTLSYQDVILHPATDYCYETFGVSHNSKPVQLKVLNEHNSVDVYDIVIGHSILDDAYPSWRTLSILQDSIVLASLIKNAQIMLIEVEGGTATKQQIEAAKLKLRSLFEGQLAMGKNGMKSYLSPQAKPAYIYSFISNGVGKITANLVGGEYNPGQLYYLTPFVNQFFSAMRVSKQNYGFTEGSAGLDSGGAVEQYNQRFKSTVARIKRIYASFIKKCINNVLVAKGLTNIVDKFDVKVFGAYDETRNQEAQELQAKLSLFTDIINFTGVDDPAKQAKLRTLMLKQVLTDPQMIAAIDEIMTSQKEPKKSDDDDTPIDDLGDTQLSPDVADELGVDSSGEGDLDIDTSDVSAEDGENLELPEMSETLPNDGG